MWNSCGCFAWLGVVSNPLTPQMICRLCWWQQEQWRNHQGGQTLPLLQNYDANMLNKSSIIWPNNRNSKNYQKLSWNNHLDSPKTSQKSNSSKPLAFSNPQRHPTAPPPKKKRRKKTHTPKKKSKQTKNRTHTQLTLTFLPPKKPSCTSARCFGETPSSPTGAQSAGRRSTAAALSGWTGGGPRWRMWGGWSLESFLGG